MKTFVWLILNVLLNFFGGIGYTALNFFIWQNNKSLPEIIQFNLSIFAALIIMSIISASASRFYGVKFSFAFSLVLRILVFFFVSANLTGVTGQIVLIGFLIGIYFEFYASARSTITQLIVPEDSMLKYNSYNQIISSAVSIASPLVTAAFINSLGYENTLRSIAIIFVGILIAFLFMGVNKAEQTLPVFSMLKDLFRSDTMRSFALINFSLGISYAFTWGILNIIILDFLGSLDGWAQVGVITAILSIVISFFLRKISSKDTSKIRALISVATLIYAIAPIIMINNFTVETFLIFTFATLVFNTFSGILTSAYLSKLQNADPEAPKRKIAYSLFSEFFTSFGEFIPIFILFIIPAQLVTTKSLILVLIFVTFAPLFFSFAFKSSNQGSD